MKTSPITRRQMLQTGTVLSVLAFLKLPDSVLALPTPERGAMPIKFLDAQPEGKGLKWENLEEWITPTENLFAVSHYGTPNVDISTHQLEISGLVRKPLKFTVD